MRCPHCATYPSKVTQTTRPIDEGLEEGCVKRRIRKCRNCARNFFTFEIHEDLFRQLDQVPNAAPLTRQPLLMEDKEKLRQRRKRGLSINERPLDRSRGDEIRD